MPLISATKEIKSNWSLIHGSVDQQIGSSLCLSLGYSSSPSENKWRSGAVCTSISPAKETDESSMDLEVDFGLYLANDKTPRPKSSTSSNPKVLDEGPAIDLELSLSGSAAESGVTTLHLTSTSPQSVIKVPHDFGGAFQTDEVSTVSYWKTGSIFHPLHAPQDKGSSYFSKQAIKEVEPSSVSSDPSSSVITNPNSSVTCTSRTKLQQRSSFIKQCQFKGCVKGARGASGFCIAHGGGRRCQKPDCHKGAEGRTAFCKAIAVVGVVNSSVVPRVQKDALVSALHMGVDAVAVAKVAPMLPEGSLDYALDMVGERNASKRTARKVPKDSLAFAFHMEVAGGVSTPSALKGHKEAPCFARPTVVENVAHLQGVIRARRGAHLSVRVMVEGKDVHSKEVEFAQRVCMEGLSSVWHMVVVRGVPYQSAPRVLGGRQLTVCAMVVVKDASSKTLEKVLREALISARLMVAEKDILGVNLVRN